MKKHILTSTQFSGEITFTFNATMRLVAVDIRAELSQEQHGFIIENMPFVISELSRFRSKTTTIIEVPLDLSFEAFWDAYGYKEGTKKRAVGMWSALSKADRIAAIEYIRIYNGKLAQTPGISRQYPETYLSSQRWKQ